MNKPLSKSLLSVYRNKAVKFAECKRRKEKQLFEELKYTDANR